jgi:hypothetical protein
MTTQGFLPAQIKKILLFNFIEKYVLPTVEHPRAPSSSFWHPKSYFANKTKDQNISFENPVKLYTLRASSLTAVIKVHFPQHQPKFK